MAANVSESPGQPPGSINNTGQSPSNPTTAKGCQRSGSDNAAAQEKLTTCKEKQPTPILCSLSKSKRRLESLDGHDDGSCNPQLENLCRKKFKPIAPKPTVKKDQHQSVLTATVPIKEAAHSDFGSASRLAKGDGKNGAIMFVSPKVQLVPSMPLLGHAPHLNGDVLLPNTSPFSMTVPLLPHGKYLSVLNPPARVSMTDVAGHYKTVVQLLPNGSSGYHIQPGHLVSASKPQGDAVCASSKPAPSKNELNSHKNGMSTNKTSKAKTVSRPKASRYKYSLLMNGGSYGANAFNAAANEKLPTSQGSLNGGLRLNLPAVLTSSGVLQISVPSVGIANGQVQFCDGLPPAGGVPIQSTVAQPAAARTVLTTVVTPSSVTATASVSTTTTNTASNGVMLSGRNDSNTRDDSVSQPVTVECAPNTNGMSLDETLRVMLRTPRATVSHDRQKETLQTKKTKPHRTCSTDAKSRRKRPKTHTSTATLSLDGASTPVTAQNGSRSGIVNTTSSQIVEANLPNPHRLHRPSGLESDQRNAGGISVSQNVQYRQADITENSGTEGVPLPPGQDVIVNQRSPGAILPNYVVNGETVNLAHPAVSTCTTPACSDPPELSRQQDVLASTSALSSTRLLINKGLGSLPSQTSDEILEYGRHSSQSVTVTTSNNPQSNDRAVNDQWSRTDMVTSRASSLPNFATGPRGFTTGTVTTPSISLNVPNHLAQQSLRDCVPVPSPMNFDSGAVAPVSTLSSSSIMQSQCPRPTPNVAVTTTNFVPLCESVTSMSGIISRTMLTSSTCSNVIVRNSQGHLRRSSSSLHSHDVQHVLSGPSVQSAQTLSESIRPPGSSLTSSHPLHVAVHQEPNANSHTAVTYSHNTVTSVHSTNHSYPILSSSSNSNLPTQPTPPVPLGTYFQEMSESRIAPIPPERGVSSVREERGAVSARRQLQLPDENPGSLHPEINGGIGSLHHNGPNDDSPPVLSRPTNQEPVVQRQVLDASVPRPNGLETASLSGARTEQNLFAPPMPVVPHHAGILATAILRSRALERTWGVPTLNVSTPSTVSNVDVPASTTSIPSTSSGFFGVTQAATGMTSSNMSHTHLADNVLHLRPPPGVPLSLGRSRDKELTGWPVTSAGIPNRNEGDILPGGHATPLPLERPGRMLAPPAVFTGVGSADLEPPGPNPVTSASGEQGQNMHVQTVPLHSNIPPNARNAMNEALQRRTRNQRIQPQSSATPSSVASTQSHTSSTVASSIQGASSLPETQPTNLGATRQEMTTSDSQQPRADLFPHQHPTHHVHTVPGTRLSSDSVPHLRMPLMAPPSVLYGSSTPMPNLSMTPLHGVPLPGSLSAHSVQGHSMAHQLHATPPPVSHLGQSTGPSPQRSVNHMFVPTPYGPIHHSLYMPPPSPHPPDLALMSPRSYGQVHMHDSVLYSPRFSSPIRNLPGSSLAEGMFGSVLPRSFSEERLDTCCSVPYTHSPPIHDNSGHMFPPGFMSPSMSRNQPSLQTSLCNTLQRPFNHHGHPSTPDRLPGPFFHESMRHPGPHQLQTPVMQTSVFASLPMATALTVCSSLDSAVQVSAASSCTPTQQTNIGNSLLVSTQSPATSATVSTTPGSTTSSSTCENATVAPSTPTSSSSTTPVRVFNLGSTSDKYLPLELVVSSPSTAVTTSAAVTTLPAQLGCEQIVKFGDVILECSRQILRESGRTVLCCWSCDYHTAEPKKMYRHQRRDELPMKCQLCSHMGMSRCQLNQHFKEVHMDKDEDPFRASAVT